MSVGTEAVSLTVDQDDILAAVRSRARGSDPACCSPTYRAARRVYGDRLVAVCWIATRYALLVEAEPSVVLIVELPSPAQAIEAAFDRLQPASFVLEGGGAIDGRAR